MAWGDSNGVRGQQWCGVTAMAWGDSNGVEGPMAQGGSNGVEGQRWCRGTVMAWGDSDGVEGQRWCGGTATLSGHSFPNPPTLQVLALKATPPPPLFHFKLGFYCQYGGVQVSPVHSAAEAVATQRCRPPYHVSLPQGMDEAAATSPQVGARAAGSPGGWALLHPPKDPLGLL